jgi:aspartate carbamoyltransferase catalytic subunit
MFLGAPKTDKYNREELTGPMEINHVLESQQFKDKALLDRLFREADFMERACKSGRCPKIMKDKIMATLFYEPSTRTRMSFESAMIRLGGSVIGTEDAFQFSSAVKGESLEDTVRVVGRYADIIVIRHPREGSARAGAGISPVPVINAGDGAGQHPTQALMDIYTIKREIGRLENLSVAMVGDLLYGRTVHSLAYLMAQRDGTKLYFVSPEQLRMPREIIKYLEKKGVAFEETSSLKNVIEVADVVYVTRIQKERFASDAEYNKLKGCYVFDNKALDPMKEKSIIMHPLPRVDEISGDVDSNPKATYFRQAENGLYIRMALLKLILGDGK